MSSTIGLVVAGAVARGAYEAGALSVVLPALEARRERPKVLVGTSSGALNAAFLASRADLTAHAATEELLDVWRQIDTKDVFRLSPATVAGLARRGRGGLLDTRPLEQTIADGIGDWGRITANLAKGRIRAVAVVTTAATTGRTTVFVQDGEPGATGPFFCDDRKGIDYVRPIGGIGIDHVLASAAVPVLFPARRIGEDWHVDGGMRLNTPIKPALHLGADKVVIVATDPARRPPRRDVAGRGRQPDFDDAALQFLQAAFADPLVEDMWRLAGVNTLLRGRHAGDKRPVGYLFVGPECQGVLGRAADETRPASLRTLLLRLALGRQGEQRRELLSYMLFEPRFIARAIALGQDDAMNELDLRRRQPGFWRLDPMPAGEPVRRPVAV